MKSLIIFLFATFATVASFAQKANNNSPATDSSKQVVYSCPMHPDYISFAAAKCPVCGDNMSKKEVMKAEIMKLYTCSMDNVICKKPGKCPKCGMEMTAYKPKPQSANN
jgi:hypothetical protein